MNVSKSSLKLIVSVLIFVAYLGVKSYSKYQQHQAKIHQQEQSTNVVTNKPTSTNASASNNNIPSKVYAVLNYVKQNHRAPDGYVGGRVFTNYERVLPFKETNGKTVHYQEWDVNPKVQGQNRGRERLVTGDDSKAWYTNNHYQSFTEVK